MSFIHARVPCGSGRYRGWRHFSRRHISNIEMGKSTID
ncbi:hypothetical protein N177_1056 [Lutibaculum baratangense AMV1]|uniref:Uncharacterized protein n=1 Tax=Lutibaculum baratangense AMV1 TaxID=631454 RepID=V4R2L8_9HYPH|nr:hypothetical protein N177_1056 [Lutibaculum baratangense AMV1]